LSWAAYAAGVQVSGGEQAISGALQRAVGAIRVLGSRVVPLFPWVPQGGFPDPFPWGQCTYYAAYQHRVTWNGNAADWWVNARAAGAAESQVPSLGRSRSGGRALPTASTGTWGWWLDLTGLGLVCGRR
jgi:hypothetical protein